MAAGDVIELRGLRVAGVVGVLPHEQAQPQPLEVDLDLHLDLGHAGRSDALGDTADYGALCDVAERVVTTTSYALLEALAEHLATAVLDADVRIEQVTVAVRKLRPPVAQQLEHVRRPDHPGTLMPRAFLGLGSNLGDRAGYLLRALASVPDLVAVSPVYETDPVGGPGDQRPYLNLVAQLDTSRSPRELLELCRTLETAAERVRVERWGPRTLDVDVLWVDGHTVADDDLEVPHPRMWERRFVVAPLADLAPDLVTHDRLQGAEGEVRRVGPLEDLPANEQGER